jgi:predicted DNA-binding protein
MKEVDRMIRTNIYLTEPQMRRLKAISKRSGLKIAEIIRAMVEEGLRKYEKEGR